MCRLQQHTKCNVMARGAQDLARRWGLAVAQLAQLWLG